MLRSQGIDWKKSSHLTETETVPEQEREKHPSNWSLQSILPTLFIEGLSSARTDLPDSSQWGFAPKFKQSPSPVYPSQQGEGILDISYLLGEEVWKTEKHLRTCHSVTWALQKPRPTPKTARCSAYLICNHIKQPHPIRITTESTKHLTLFRLFSQVDRGTMAKEGSTVESLPAFPKSRVLP